MLANTLAPYKKTRMVQTPSGAAQNPWIVHMRKCAAAYRQEQAEKAKAEAAPKKRLHRKTSPQEARKPAAEKPVEASKPKRRLVRKTSPEEALAAAAAPPPPPVVAAQRRRILKKMSEAGAHAAAAAKTTPKEPKPEPKRRLTKKTPTIHSRWQEAP